MKNKRELTVVLRLSTAFALVLILFLSLFLLKGEVVVNATDEHEKVVKVARVISEKLPSWDETYDASESGCEYLQNISKYTGWKYEYVDGSLEESLERLANGEVDLMAELTDLMDTSELISLSNMEHYEAVSYIYVNNGQTKFDAGDLSTFNGARIGILVENYQISMFEEWCSSNAVECELVEYADVKAMKNDLTDGVLDALVSAGENSDDELSPLVYLWKEQFYFGVSGSRPDLLNELNSVMNELKISGLSASNMKWLDEHGSIRIGFYDNCMPYSGIDADTGRLKGILADFIEYFELEYGISFETVAYSSYDEMLGAIADNSIDAAFPASEGYDGLELYGGVLTDAIVSSIIDARGEDLQEPVGICFAVNQGNTQLLAVLDKCISAADDSLIFNSLISNSRNDYEHSIKDIVMEHLSAVFAAVFVFLVILDVILFCIWSIRRNRKIITSVRWEALHDSLTGLHNRASYKEITKKLKGEKAPLAVLIIDVDTFKSINDTYGHKMGDRALQKVGKLLRKWFRTDDYIIRYGGDEFVVFITNITEADTVVITNKINEINKALQNPDDGLPKFSISVGIAFSSDGYDEELFNQADSALYCTKENGRCGYTVFDN